jgi:NapC/NirT cytochrome c family, N-terminal region
MGTLASFRNWLRPIFYLGNNWLSLLGATLTTSSAVTLLLFWISEIFRGGAVPSYTGIIFFLILPTVFVVGLALIPAGFLWRRRKLRSQGQLPAAYPSVNLRDPLLRRAGLLVGVATIVNIVLLSTATYHAVQYTDSVQFCGQTCHSVMAPEYTAYQGSPHSRVACAECHIGPGAPWFVRAKISGVRQVLAVALNTYERPIPSPVHSLRPARETCEQCHWPQKFEGDKLLVKASFEDDEGNTKLATVLLLKLGGSGGTGGVGIHGHHLDTDPRVHYLPANEQRLAISRVRYRDDDGKIVEFVASDAPEETAFAAPEQWRTMDCMDCHNRPTHTFQLPETAVDEKMADGTISPQLPFIKKEAVELLETDYSSRDEATQKLAAALNEYYRTQFPQVYAAQKPLLEKAIRGVQAIYLRNVFPEMKVSWGTYPNFLGHEDSPGCFRCHDGDHSSADGRTITQDCGACHSVLAYEEPDPEILQELSLQ